ncbi:MAG: hypothetical protein AAF824_23170 [Bacteroidota bacterium]
MRISIFSLVAICSLCIQACAQPIPDKEKQIQTALMAAPEDVREGAAVLGYDAKGELISLREGTNLQVCVADDPAKEGFQVVCYHKALSPFMERGRALRAEGKNGNEIFSIREEEAKAGTLAMPEQPTTLHLLEGKEVEWNEEEGELAGARYRYVVYIPWATAESSGLPTKPIVPGGPWIMDPGTHRAHIMITPPVME